MKYIPHSILLFLLLCWLAPIAPVQAGAQTFRGLVRKAEVKEAQHKSAEALALYLKAEELQPGRTRNLIAIAKQYADLINDEPDKVAQKALCEQALVYARQALAQAPNDADANLLMAVCYCKLVPYISLRERADLCHAIKAYSEKAVALNPRSDYAHHLLGRWHQEVAQIGAVERALARALFGGIPRASLETALEQFDEARKLRPDRLMHQVEYGRTLIMMRRKVEGRRELERGLAMPNTEKDDPEAKRRGKETLDSL